METPLFLFILFAALVRKLVADAAEVASDCCAANSSMTTLMTPEEGLRTLKPYRL